MFDTRTVNITLEVPDHNITGLETFLGDNFKLINYKIIPDTKELYENISHFRALCKKVKDAQRERDIFINDHNK